MYKGGRYKDVPSYPQPERLHFSSLDNNDAEGNETES